MEKTQIMRPPFYKIDIESINLKSPMKKPPFFDEIPPWQIHPMNLPRWQDNPDIESLVEEYNDKAFDRNTYADTWFVYEAYIMLKCRLTKEHSGNNFSLLTKPLSKNEGDCICNLFKDKPTHKYEKYFAEYSDYEKTICDF